MVYYINVFKIVHKVVFTLKEKIYTIPLTDAYAALSECPFCELEKKLEKEAAEYALGASMMEPESRIESNKKGFCRRHFEFLLKEQKALSLALVLDTHLAEIVNTSEGVPAPEKQGLFAKKASFCDEIAKKVSEFNSGCVICDKLEYTLTKFARVFWYLYKNEPEFKEKVLNSNGFCLPHFELILKNAKAELGEKNGELLAKEIIELELKSLKTLNEDTNWFTKKFDYRFKDAPWNNSKDAIPRAVNKLAKFTAGNEE